MTETPTLPPIAPAPADMPQASKDTARALFEKHGYRAEDIAAAGYGTGVAPAQNYGAAAAALLPQPASPTSLGHVSDAAKVTALKNALACGVAPDLVQRAAAEEGIGWDQVSKDAAPAPQSMSLDDANQKLADASGPLAAGTAPADYRLTFDPAHVDGLDQSDVATLDGMFKGAFHEAGVPLSISQPVFRALMDGGAKFADTEDGPARTLAFREEGARLQRLPNIAQIKADAEYAYSKMPADFQAVMNDRFMMHTAEGYHAMARVGQMIREREARKK